MKRENLPGWIKTILGFFGVDTRDKLSRTMLGKKVFNRTEELTTQLSYQADLIRIRINQCTHCPPGTMDTNVSIRRQPSFQPHLSPKIDVHCHICGYTVVVPENVTNFRKIIGLWNTKNPLHPELAKTVEEYGEEN